MVVVARGTDSEDRLKRKRHGSPHISRDDSMLNAVVANLLR